VIVTNAMNQSEFILGDWTMGARIYDREDVTVRVSESHEDFFIKNAVAILAEERYTMAVVRPLAFTKGSFEIELT
jgi:HK97 family phage major capsid protein